MNRTRVELNGPDFSKFDTDFLLKAFGLTHITKTA